MIMITNIAWKIKSKKEQEWREMAILWGNN
jgi:hypothetical protein